jgi:hypothetical protein
MRRKDARSITFGERKRNGCERNGPERCAHRGIR